MKGLDKFIRKAVVKTLDGEKLYKFRVLKRRDASRVFHESTRIVAKLLAGAIGSDTVEAKIAAIDSLGFDEVWDLAADLLKGCVICPDMENLQHMITISDLDETDYFNDNNEELYIAMYHALQANFPKLFSRLTTALEGSAPEIQAKIAEKFGIASTPKQQPPSPSQSGGEPTPTE